MTEDQCTVVLDRHYTRPNKQREHPEEDEGMHTAGVLAAADAAVGHHLVPEHNSSGAPVYFRGNGLAGAPEGVTTIEAVGTDCNGNQSERVKRNLLERGNMIKGG